MAPPTHDMLAHASLVPPKPQPPCCPNCRGIPSTVACHDPQYDDSDDEGSDEGFVHQFPTHRRRRYWLQPSIEALEKSAADGCPLCALFYRMCLDSIHGNPHKWKHGNGDPRLELSHGGTTPYVMGTRMGDWHVQGFNFVAAPGDWSKRYDSYFGNENDPTVIKFWVNECTTQHEEHCTSDSDFLPTRLIDLGTSLSGENGDIVRVIHTADTEIHDRRYMTLSHRWDKSTVESAQSTSDNIIHHQQRLSLSSLPRSFQYTACVARQLGIRYLWIDSLCILQDSRVDWMRESAQMGRVYGGAFCTIATTNDALAAYGKPESNVLAKNQWMENRDADAGDEEGLPEWVQICVGKQSEERKESEGEAHIVRIFDRTPWDWETMLDQTILSGRGWTLQERQLSRRIIHVTQNALLWECRTCRGSDQVPWTDQVAANMTKDARYRIKDMIENPRHTPRRSDPSFLYGIWYELVWDYSNRLLTVESDKLPGLAGLAKTMAAMLDDEYLAGLWKKDIVSGLLWKSRRWVSSYKYEGQEIPGRMIMPAPPGFYPAGPHGPIEQSRPRQRRAPTWSWASLGGQVIHWMGSTPSHYYDPEVDKSPVIAPEVVDVDMTVPGRLDDDPFSQANGGRITIKGYLQPAKARYFLRDLFLSNLDSSFWTDGYKSVHDPADGELTTPSSLEADEARLAIALEELRKRGPHHREQEQKDCIGVIQYDVVDEIVPNQTVYVLALRRITKDQWDTPYCVWSEEDENGFPFHDQVFGLALVPTGEGENEYKRVGLAEFIPVSWFKEGHRKTVTIV